MMLPSEQAACELAVNCPPPTTAAGEDTHATLTWLVDVQAVQLGCQQGGVWQQQAAHLQGRRDACGACAKGRIHIACSQCL